MVINYCPNTKLIPTSPDLIVLSICIYQKHNHSQAASIARNKVSDPTRNVLFALQKFNIIGLKINFLVAGFFNHKKTQLHPQKPFYLNPPNFHNTQILKTHTFRDLRPVISGITLFRAMTASPTLRVALAPARDSFFIPRSCCFGVNLENYKIYNFKLVLRPTVFISVDVWLIFHMNTILQ